jgi:hypothetical protein
MIRPAPSAIILGPGDLKEFETRQKQHIYTSVRNCIPAPLLYETTIRTKSSSAPGVHGNEELTRSPPVAESEHPTSTDLTEDQVRQLSMGYHSSPENTYIGATPISPPKIGPEYAELIEGVTQQSGNDTSELSFPFSTHLGTPCVEEYTNRLVDPEDNSTPPYPLVREAPGVQSRLLARSPLFRFQNASGSPESRSESLLSSLSSHNIAQHTSAEEFSSQPARRPNRTFRHQTNSFSFDDSVRASAAYEQDRISSTSTTDSIPRPKEHISLQEELRGSSLSNGRVSSAELSAAGVQEDHQSVISRSESTRNHIFFSAELPLPPPFSTVSRNASVAGSLPSAHGQNPSNWSTSSVNEAFKSSPSQHTGLVNLASINSRRPIEHVDDTALGLAVSSIDHEVYWPANIY